MADTWATADDIRKAWLLAPEELPSDDQITEWIGKAERHIRSRDQTLVDRMATETDLIEAARDVVVDMLLRVLLNPERARAVADGTGPFSGSTTFAGDDPGTLYLTRANRVDLGMSTRRRRQVAFTIDPTPASARHRRYQ